MHANTWILAIFAVCIKSLELPCTEPEFSFPTWHFYTVAELYSEMQNGSSGGGGALTAENTN